MSEHEAKPCVSCGGTNVSLLNCGYSSFNAGHVKCLSCGYEVSVNYIDKDEDFLRHWDGEASRILESMEKLRAKAPYLFRTIEAQASEGCAFCKVGLGSCPIHPGERTTEGEQDDDTAR